MTADNSSFYHQDLNDQSSWDDVRRVFGLSASKLGHLRQNDPRTEKGRDLWVAADVTMHDATQLYDRLSVSDPIEETTQETTEETETNDEHTATATAGNGADTGVADSTPARKRAARSSSD